MGIPTITRIPDGKIMIGVSGLGTAATLSGDITTTSGGVTSIGATKVTAAMLGSNLGKGYIPLELGALRLTSGNDLLATSEGMLLDTNTDPILQRINGATDKAHRVVWAANSVVEVDFPPFAYPPDLDDTAAVVVNLLISKDTNTNTTATLAVTYFEGIGDSDAGGNTAATNATAITKYTVSITAANVGPYATMAKVGIIPGAHANDAFRLHAAWIEYTRKS